MVPLDEVAPWLSAISLPSAAPLWAVLSLRGCEAQQLAPQLAQEVTLLLRGSLARGAAACLAFVASFGTQ